MVSTGLELAGLAALVAGVYVLAGLGCTLLAGGGALLFVAYAVSAPVKRGRKGKLPGPLTNRDIDGTG